MVPYADPDALASAVARLRELPPLVTSGEVERLRSLIADAQQGRRFLLQGGDCAETLVDCRPGVITAKLKILLQMSLVLAFAGKKPVIRVGRLAGQYAKPRSQPTETRPAPANGPVTLPAYFGDLINRHTFTAEARQPDPRLLVEAYQHAALTLNFIRSLIDAGFASAHHPEAWDLSFLRRAGLPADLAGKYQRLTERLAESLRFMEALGERSVEDITGAEFYTSHEALSLHYDSAQTRTVPRRHGWYNLSTHLPWLGERTRRVDGAHVEYLRGIRNPVGVKIGPNATPADLLTLLHVLNPGNEPGRIVVIPRMGADKVAAKLPPLVDATLEHRLNVLWVCDPMHGNTTTTPSGLKTRALGDICSELLAAFDILRQRGSHLGGVHVELTGDDVTECIGGASGLSEKDLALNYASPCDPRLNYEQAMELAFALAEKLEAARA